MKRALRGSLLFRLYAIGLVQVALVLVAAAVAGVAVRRWSTRVDMPSVIESVRPLATRHADLETKLAALRAEHGVLLSLYDDAGHVVATNVDPPLHPPMWHGGPPEPPGGLGAPPGPPSDLGPPPFPDPFAGPPPGAGPPHPPETFAQIDLGGHTGVLVARFERRSPSLVPVVAMLAVGLLVAGLGALLTARWIARPLDRLAGAAQALGRGQLSARAEVGRSEVFGVLGEAFDDMARRIEVLLRAEKELLANVSHELRTPLARIRVALDLAAEGDTATARASIEEIALDLAELEALLDDVLSATRLDLASGDGGARGFSLHEEPTAPEAMAKAASGRFRVRHPGRPFEMTVATGLPPIAVDRVLFRRVLDNLLENAHKYSPDAALPVAVDVRSAGEGVCFEVVDRGMGIAAADLPRVFDPFFRAERSRSRGTGGVGLGLTLVRRIVDAHGATVEVESVVGVGTKVRVTIPAATP